MAAGVVPGTDSGDLQGAWHPEPFRVRNLQPGRCYATWCPLNNFSGACFAIAVKSSSTVKSC